MHVSTKAATSFLLCYTNLFSEEMELEFDDMDSTSARQNYQWRKDHPNYQNVRWVKINVITTTTRTPVDR